MVAVSGKLRTTGLRSQHQKKKKKKKRGDLILVPSLLIPGKKVYSRRELRFE
jgi:hypothetical protein